MKFPRWIDGTALYIGAFIPDLNIFVFEPLMFLQFRHITHSLLGLLIWVAPLTILMAIIFSKYIGPKISEIVKKERKLCRIFIYFGFDELQYLKKKQINARFFVVAFYSALIGGFTHLIIDLPAHRYNELFFPWALFVNPEFLRVPVFELNRIIPLYEVIWYIEDIILLGISLVLLRKIKKDNLIERWYESVK